MWSWISTRHTHIDRSAEQYISTNRNCSPDMRLIKNGSATGEKAVLDVLRQKGLLDQRLAAELAKVKAQQSAWHFQ